MEKYLINRKKNTNITEKNIKSNKIKWKAKIKKQMQSMTSFIHFSCLYSLMPLSVNLFVCKRQCFNVNILT